MLFEHLEQRIRLVPVGNLAVGRRREVLTTRRAPDAPQRRQANACSTLRRFVVKVGRDISNRSVAGVTTSSGRSVLLTTRIAGKWAASALRQNKPRLRQ